MSKGIRIRLQNPTERGRLYPRYDEEADVLEVGSSVQRDWLYGVDIDGNVVFDLDSDRVLANFDLLVPKYLWKVTESAGRWSSPSQEADLQFHRETLKHKSFHLPLEVTTDEKRSLVSIRFGEVNQQARVIILSESCLALVEADHLLGFLLKLL